MIEPVTQIPRFYCWLCPFLLNSGVDLNAEAELCLGRVAPDGPLEFKDLKYLILILRLTLNYLTNKILQVYWW